MKCVHIGSQRLLGAFGLGSERDSLQPLSPPAIAMEGVSKGEQE